MDIIFIYRNKSKNGETLGTLVSTTLQKLHTLELLDKNNEPNISNIPEGCYRYEKWYSPHFKMKVLRLLDVPNRTNILVHPANYVSELRGCIAAGKRLWDINGDGKLDVTSSRDAVRKLVNSVTETGIICINNAIKL